MAGIIVFSGGGTYTYLEVLDEGSFDLYIGQLSHNRASGISFLGLVPQPEERLSPLRRHRGSVVEGRVALRQTDK